MTAYIVRRLFLMVPTLFGIMLLNFLVLQFVPGGPVEQVLAQMTGEGGSATMERVTRSGGPEVSRAPTREGATGAYRGAQGLDPEFIAELERQFGFDKPAHERFFLMLGNYLVFDFGESFFRGRSVAELVVEKLPVSPLGLWFT